MEFISNIWSKTTSAIVPEGGEPAKSVATEDCAAAGAGGESGCVTDRVDEKGVQENNKKGDGDGGKDSSASPGGTGGNATAGGGLPSKEDAKEQHEEGVTTQVLHNVENVSHKAMEGAKSFGSFLFSVANKAGKTVTDTATKVKTAVEENSILADFNREQDSFLAARSKSASGTLPWTGCENEQEMKKQIISLSEDKRTFVRNPPNGVQFEFDLEGHYAAVAMAMLREDTRLEKMRFELVPKLISEQDFWRNYFYRVSLVKQSSQLSSLTKSGSGGGSTDTSTASGPQTPSDDGIKDDDAADGTATSDFVSEAYEGKVSAEEVEKGMQQLGCLEKELEKELDGYEVVSSEAAGGIADDDDLESEIQNLLSATRK